MQASPRVDVNEAPGAELLFTTELVAIHDSIKLLNSDDNLGLYMETLPYPTLMQLLDNARGITLVVRVLLSRSQVSSRVNLKSMFLS